MHPALKNDIYDTHVRVFISELKRVNSLKNYQQVKSKIPQPIKKLRKITYPQGVRLQKAILGTLLDKD